MKASKHSSMEKIELNLQGQILPIHAYWCLLAQTPDTPKYH